MPRSRLYLLEHGEDFTFESLDVRFNCLQRARRFVAVEMAVEQVVPFAKANAEAAFAIENSNAPAK